METEKFLQAIKLLFSFVIPFIQKLIESKAVPILKRKGYEALNNKADKLIEDLAQNAAKIAAEKDPLKKTAFTEGTKLGVDTIRAISEKLSKAADEIEKVI